MISFLDRVITVAAALIVAATAAVTCLAVFFRSVLGASLPWPEEVSGNALVWTSFLGAYLAVRDQRHISFDLLLERLPVTTHKVVGTIGDGLVIGFFSLLIYQSIKMIRIVGGTSLQSVDIPIGVFMAALPVCGGAIIVAVALRIAMRWRRPA